MFTPEILTVPMFSVLGSGAVLYPTIGVVLAWAVIAAFVGSVLGLLREGLGAAEQRRADHTKVVHRPATPAAVARECWHAA